MLHGWNDVVLYHHGRTMGQLNTDLDYPKGRVIDFSWHRCSSERVRSDRSLGVQSHHQKPLQQHVAIEGCQHKLISFETVNGVETAVTGFRPVNQVSTTSEKSTLLAKLSFQTWFSLPNLVPGPAACETVELPDSERTDERV